MLSIAVINPMSELTRVQKSAFVAHYLLFFLFSYMEHIPSNPIGLTTCVKQLDLFSCSKSPRT